MRLPCTLPLSSRHICWHVPVQAEGVEMSVLLGLDWRLGPYFDLGPSHGSGP